MIAPLDMIRAVGAVRHSGRAVKADALDAEWEAIESVRSRVARKIAGRMAEGFREQAREVDRAIDGVLSSYGYTKASPEELERAIAEGRAGAVILSVVWEEWAETEFRDLIFESIELGFHTGVARITVEDIDYGISQAQEDVVRDISGKIKGTVQASREEIAGIVARGVEEGVSREELRRRINDRFRDWETYRVDRIAQTTATGGFESGQAEAYAIAGIDSMTWLSQRDGRVRESHQAGRGVDGETIRVGGVFRNGLRYPGDPLGRAEEVIGCRCSTVPVIKPKSVEVLRAFNPRERGRIDLAIRDLAIRTLYPSLRESHGQTEAIARLADKFATSESTVKRVLWE